MAARNLMLHVYGPNSVVRSIAFDNRPLTQQVRSTCDEFGLCSEENTIFLLTRGVSAESMPIRSKAELLAIPEQTDIGFHRAVDVAKARLSAIQNASVADIEVELQNLSAAVHSNGALAEEFVVAGGIDAVRTRIVGHLNFPSLENMEPAAACLCELLHYDAAAEWLSEHEELLDCVFFAYIFATLFSTNNSFEQWNEPTRSPRASLSVFLFLLQRFPKCAAAVHEAAEGTVYQHIREVIANGNDEFQVSTAVSVVCAMTRASSSNEPLQQRMLACLLENAGGFAEEVLKTILERDGRDDRYTDQLLFMGMDACSELAAERADSEDCDKLRQEIQRLRQKQARDKSADAILRNELRKWKNALKVMVGFVKVDRCLMVERILPAVVKNGWDSIQWKGGYSMLHMVCEGADDPKIVELVAAFAPDLERADDKGMRPIDYARQNKKHPSIVAEFEKLRRQKQASKLPAASLVAPVVAPDAAALRQWYAKLEGVSEKLKTALEAVLEKGWHHIKWPRGVTAVHFAAMQGHAGAVELLAAAGADVNAQDDFGSKPIDYAMQGNHMAVVAALDKLRFAAASESQVKLAGTTSNTSRRRLTEWPGEQLDDQKLVDLLDAMPPQSREMCAAVAKNGWRTFQWKDNFSFLHQCSLNGSAEAVQFLLQANASPMVNIQDDKGMTPLAYAKKHNHQNVIEILSPLTRSGTSPVTPATLSEPATPHIIVDTEGQPAAVPSSTVDATTESAQVQCRRQSQMEIDEVFAELERLKAEKADLLEERQKRQTSLPALTTFVDEDRVLELVVQLQSFGRDAVHAKLQEDRPSGGLALPEQDATRVTKQLELIGRIHTELSSEQPLEKKATKPSNSSNSATGTPEVVQQSVELSTEASPSLPQPNEGPKGASKGGKKGKAPTPPPKGKGSATKVVQPSKPRISSRVPMKPIWLTRYLMGQHMVEDETIWSAVADAADLVPKDELEDRFAKNASAFVITNVGNQEEGDKVKKDKFIRIITDPQVVGAKQAALKRFPNADAVCQAIVELDETVITLDGLMDLMQHACPEPAQVEQLKKAREAKPELPLALPEHFMWKISQIAAYKARLDCWFFIRTLEDRCAHLMQGLRRFAVMVDACRNSKALSSLLGLILAFANYCNADSKDRGQADGFDLTGIHNFEKVRDACGKDLRHLIFKVYFSVMKIQAEELFADFRPLFDNVFRSIQRDHDGAEQLSKKVDVKMEDYDSEVSVLSDEFQQNDAKMRMLMQYIEDPADQCVLQMPPLFEKAEKSLKELAWQRNETKQRYSGLLRWLKINAMSSEDFCLLWDDFFVPESLFIGKPKLYKKDFLEPTFCQTTSSENFQPLRVESLQVLWGFQCVPARKISSGPRGGAAQRAGKRGQRFRKQPSPLENSWSKIRSSLAIVAAMRRSVADEASFLQ